MEPMARFCSYFPEINEAIKNRQKTLSDYDSAKSKVRKLVDKPSEDPQRLPRVSKTSICCNYRTQLYHRLNKRLIWLVKDMKI